jgi:hypothetical protein
MAADKRHAPPQAKPPMGLPGGGESEHEEGGHSIIPHGDGTFHSMSAEGERTEHPTAGHAAVHFLLRHGEEGKHLHAHSDGVEHTTHQSSGEEVEGPHNHDNIEALKDHLGQFFDEEKQEKY